MFRLNPQGPTPHILLSVLISVNSNIIHPTKNTRLFLPTLNPAGMTFKIYPELDQLTSF